MVDFHSHVLPCMDDGSKSMDMSLAMMEAEAQQGVDKIIATPHFYGHRDSMEDFLERRQRSYQRLVEAETGQQILLGSEVCYFQGIGCADSICRLCIEGTNVMLLELPSGQWNQEIYENVKNLIERQKLTIVLAHVERFYKFQKNPYIWDRVKELPLYWQMNAGAFLDWKRRKTALQLLKGRKTVLLGSDCHNMELRGPNLAAGREVIARKLGKIYLERTDKLSEEVLS